MLGQTSLSDKIDRKHAHIVHQTFPKSPNVRVPSVLACQNLMLRTSIYSVIYSYPATPGNSEIGYSQITGDIDEFQYITTLQMCL